MLLVYLFTFFPVVSDSLGPYCNNDDIEISCPDGTVIEITEGVYGRFDNSTCDNINAVGDTNCYGNVTDWLNAG